MNNKKIIFVIPARLASTRLPEKPLAMIGPLSMIQHVYTRVKSANVGDVVVATCSQKIVQQIHDVGGEAILTDPDLPSGTDRAFHAMKSLNKTYDFLVNVQGDLPFVQPDDLVALTNAMIQSNCMTTLCAPMAADDIQNPNAVKVVVAFDGDQVNTGNALYFSRSPVPYNAPRYYHHIGIYGYPVEVLEKFVSLRPSNLENIEKLEQLRALENDIKIRIKCVDNIPLSIDTPEDLEAAKEHYKIHSTGI
jgi:3-deoxy-manno-octulosonate cytidylyltransferase (CMP-KDO synthetase)